MRKIQNDWSHPDANMLGDFYFDDGSSCSLIEVGSIHALNQLVGYVKYINKDEGGIFFRGQTDVYKSLFPSIYRTGDQKKTAKLRIPSRNQKIASYVQQSIKKLHILKDNVDARVCEPLLQHYGIKTRWIDLVDNLWVSLWFSIHKYTSVIADRDYEYVYRRDDLNGNSYLLLVYSDAIKPDINVPGLFHGETTDLVDLRMAVPSVFLRPHCQHALLMKPKKADSILDVNLSRNVCAIIKMNVANVIKWIGNGLLLTAENIYPSPVYDQGYRILLEHAPHRKKEMNNLGSITAISYSLR